ncbi:hypothetical protein HAV_00156 [Candidatus Hepatincola sp. Av]
MKKLYSLQGDKKSLLEEILNRNRRRLSKQLLQRTTKASNSLSKTYQSTKSTFAKNTTKVKVNTILKAIGFRKAKKSLPILINYVLRKTGEMYNELGEVITNNKIDEEAKRFNLMNDADNKKRFAKSIKEGSLKHRQILHLSYSLPNNNPSNKEKLLKVAESLGDVFPEHKYVYGLHNNTKNMHLHIVVKCKNDVTKKRLRIGGKELVNINKYLYNKCQEQGIDLVATNTKKKQEANKKLHKLPDFMKKTAPKFCEMYEKNSFSYISANKSTLESLKKLDMKEEDIKKFLWLYHENKQQAIYSINNSPKIFGLNKHRLSQYKKQNNGKGFTLRKVDISFVKKTQQLKERER